MQSPLKKIIVYDLETGGLLSTHNSITEIALVAIDLETLKIIDETSVLIKPRIDLSSMCEDSLDEAKSLYKRLATKDLDSGIKTLKYGKEKITLKNIQPLVDGIDNFKEILHNHFKLNILNHDDINYLEGTNYKDISSIYFDNAYNPQALEVTKISKKLLVDEGVEYEKAFEIVNNFIKSHTVGNSKPIIAGHNIGWLPRRIVRGKEVKPNGFDNPFMEKFFKDNKSDFFSSINDLIYDTLQMARTKYWELPSYSLGVVANELGLTLKEAHRALPDTIANAKVLIKMLKSLRGGGDSKKNYVREKFDLNY